MSYIEPNSQLPVLPAKRIVIAADIVLDGEPLRDIPAVRRIVFVMKGGVVYKNTARGMISLR